MTHATVRGGLEKAFEEPCDARDGFFLAVLAPIIEKALRAAYDKGYDDMKSVYDPAGGVTAGVAAITKG